LTGLAGSCDVVIIVDVLSFSTCVDVALGRGGVVLPFARRDREAQEFAREVGAECAGPRGSARFSLSPATLASIRDGERVVLPSPNGGALCLQTGSVPTFTACLRNAVAVARAAVELGRRVLVIAAGETWPSGTLRPALEDWIGAGAVAAVLPGPMSPEAEAARHAFEGASADLATALRECVSGRELVDRGYEEDIEWAAAVNVSASAPLLREGAFATTHRAARSSDAV